MEPGKTYTAMAVARLIAPLTGALKAGTPTIQAFWKRSDGGYSSKTSGIVPNTIGVSPQRVTFTIPEGATEAFVRLYNGTNRTNGDVWYDNFMLVEGEYTGDYVDGSKPFSKWEGTANDSNSIGYPPQFLDIAGKPDRELLALGSMLNSSPGIDPAQAKSFYCVYESTGWTTAYNAIAIHGSTSNGRITIQSGAAGQTTTGVRVDFPGGESNRVFYFNNGRSVGRHVFAGCIEQGLTTARICLDGAADLVVSGLNPGTGWNPVGDNYMVMSSAGESTGLRWIVFNTAHDRATRLAVSRYLGNKYGAAVA
jgi:hypothetical protein